MLRSKQPPVARESSEGGVFALCFERNCDITPALFVRGGQCIYPHGVAIDSGVVYVTDYMAIIVCSHSLVMDSSSQHLAVRGLNMVSLIDHLVSV